MSKDVSILELDRISNVLQRRCGSMGVSLKWDPNASTAMTNGKEIIIPSVTLPVTTEAMDKLYGFVIHESGHHTRPDVFKILRALDNPPQALCALFNIAEDDGMEREVAEKYIGDAVGLGKQNNIILGELTKEWTKNPWPANATVQQVAPLSICALGQLSRMKWDTMSTTSRAGFFNSLPPTAKTLTDDLVTEGWVDRLLKTEDPHDTWDLACDLYKRLYPNEDQDKIEEQRAAGHSMKPNDSKNSDGASSGASKESGDGPDGDGEQAASSGTPKDGDDSKGAAQPDEGTVVSWKDVVLSEHNEWQAKDKDAQAGNVGIDWEDYRQGDVGLMPQHMVNVINCRDKTMKVGTGYRSSPSDFISNNAGSRAFGNQIRRYLQAQRRTRVNREQYHGKLDKSSLVKLAMPPIDGGEWNKKLFYDLDRRKEMNTCIHVLTDWSGSMQGSKMCHAADASGRLVHVFDRVLNVPVQLAAFTNGATRCDIGLIKAFKDRSISPENIAENFSKFYSYSSANNDADSVMWAYNQLIPRKEDRKILIVLSDGAPAGSWQGESSANLRHVCKQIEKEGKVELYGVGICSQAVKNYYSNHKVLNSSEEINNVLFDIIKEGAYRYGQR